MCRSALILLWAACLSVWGCGGGSDEEGAGGLRTLRLSPVADTTLYAEGALSNGRGQFLFTGTNGMNAARRALLRFDLSVIPADAIVLDARIVVFVSRVPASGVTGEVTVHRMRAPWGEGGTDAEGPEGGGGPALPGDPTWLAASHLGQAWTTPGGDFEAAVRAQHVLQGITTAQTFAGEGLVEDCQAWIQGAPNLGWLLLSVETRQPTVKRIDSREHPDPGRRPYLEVQFTQP